MMKKIIALLLVLVMALSLTACKCKAVRETEERIETVKAQMTDEINDKTARALKKAFRAYNALSREEKEKVSNYGELEDASYRYAQLLEQDIRSREYISVDDACELASGAPLGDEEWMAFVEELNNMAECDGTYYQASEYADNGKYSAEVTYYLKFGECWADIDYENYGGIIDSNKLLPDGEDGFLFKVETTGGHFIGSQRVPTSFLMRFAPDHMYVEWDGDLSVLGLEMLNGGSKNQYDLTRE